jgi:hypothetical protein
MRPEMTSRQTKEPANALPGEFPIDRPYPMEGPAPQDDDPNPSTPNLVGLIESLGKNWEVGKVVKAP